jgi:shikimate dehydrogenase
MSPAYGLIGYPLTHSFSPAWFAKKFAAQGIDATYTAFPLATINDFPAFLQQHPALHGLNVTIPHKETIIPYLGALDITAEKVGAVNCVAISDGLTKGYNTDVIGFKESLVPLLQSQHTNALVLGTGGASGAVTYVLDELGIEFIKVSRTATTDILTYDALTSDIIRQHTLIINTTPVGMYPHVDDCPQLPYEAIGAQHLLYDLIYNPAETKFLALGKQAGAQIKNGQQMLELQADASWRIWNVAR